MQALYTTHEVGALIGVDQSTVAKWIDRGWLVAFRTPGGHRRVREADLRAFLQAKGMPVPAELGGGGFKMVAVDDEKGVLDAFKRSIKRHAPQVDLFTTTSPVEALLHVAEERPHAMLIDIHLPDLDGLEVCRRIRARPALAGVAIVLFTANHSPEIVDKALKAGARACLPKPVDVPTLLEMFRVPIALNAQGN
jgi:excisionase family DNA binding protein